MLQEKFKRHLQRSRFFDNQQVVVVAVSTGVDSMVLLDLLQGLPQALRPTIIVAHVNHELRKQSVQEEQFLRHYCVQHQLKLRITHWPVGDHPRHGVEAAARQFRYDFFARIMQEEGSTVLVTAHHENDLAETMLMKLVRGGQLDQLVGIADQRRFKGGTVVRPLLPFKKAELYAYARKHHLKWYEDQTNHDLTIERNRFRHQYLPALERENAQLLNHLASYHEQLTTLLTWRNNYFEQILDKVAPGEVLDLTSLKQYSRTQQVQLLQYWLEKQGVRDLKVSLLTMVEAVLNNPKIPQCQLDLTANYRLIKNYTRAKLQIVNKLTEKPQNQQQYMVKLGQRYPVDQGTELLVSDQEVAFTGTTYQEMWLAPQQLPLILRPWQAGDYLLLKGGGHQKVSRVLIDRKVPTDQRRHQLVLVDAQGVVVWLVNHKWSWFERPADYQQVWRKLFIGKQDRGEHYE